MIRRFHDAKAADLPEVVIWGSGQPRREFLHVDDMADASIHLMRVWAELSADGSIVDGSSDINDIVNIGYGDDVSIGELAVMVRDIVDYRGSVRFDPSKPDGTPRKLLDSSRLRATGWKPSIPLNAGIERTYRWFLAHHDSARLGNDAADV